MIFIFGGFLYSPRSHKPANTWLAIFVQCDLSNMVDFYICSLFAFFSHAEQYFSLDVWLSSWVIRMTLWHESISRIWLMFMSLSEIWLIFWVYWKFSAISWVGMTQFSSKSSETQVFESDFLWVYFDCEIKLFETNFTFI